MIVTTIRTGTRGPAQVMADAVATAFTTTGMVLGVLTEYHPMLLLYRANRALAQVLLPR